MKGNTGAFTHTNFSTLSGISWSEIEIPKVAFAAILATGKPVDLATNGTVRELRGFTSRTYNSLSLTAN